MRFGCSMVFTKRLWMDTLQVPYGEVREYMGKYRVLLSIQACLYVDENSKGL